MIPVSRRKKAPSATHWVSQKGRWSSLFGSDEFNLKFVPVRTSWIWYTIGRAMMEIPDLRRSYGYIHMLLRDMYHTNYPSICIKVVTGTHSKGSEARVWINVFVNQRITQYSWILMVDEYLFIWAAEVSANVKTVPSQMIMWPVDVWRGGVKCCRQVILLATCQCYFNSFNVYVYIVIQGHRMKASTMPNVASLWPRQKRRTFPSLRFCNFQVTTWSSFTKSDPWIIDVCQNYICPCHNSAL